MRILYFCSDRKRLKTELRSVKLEVIAKEESQTAFVT